MKVVHQKRADEAPALLFLDVKPLLTLDNDIDDHVGDLLQVPVNCKG